MTRDQLIAALEDASCASDECTTEDIHRTVVQEMLPAIVQYVAEWLEEDQHDQTRTFQVDRWREEHA